MISFMAVSQMAVEGTSFSLSSSRNACFASSRVAYCGFASSLVGGGKKEADEIEGGGKKEADEIEGGGKKEEDEIERGG